MPARGYKAPSGPKPGGEAIYGTDDTTLANRIANDCLTDTSNKAREDYWGSTFDQQDKSKGNKSYGGYESNKDNSNVRRGGREDRGGGGGSKSTSKDND